MQPANAFAPISVTGTSSSVSGITASAAEVSSHRVNVTPAAPTVYSQMGGSVSGTVVGGSVSACVTAAVSVWTGSVWG